MRPMWCCKVLSQVGWKHGALIQRLEGQRKVKSEAFYKKKACATSGNGRALTKRLFSAFQTKLIHIHI